MEIVCRGHEQQLKVVVKEGVGTVVLLVRIWQEATRLRVASRTKESLSRLDEFKREMWLLLVAAGSSYLARCWHRTLKQKASISGHLHLSDEEKSDISCSSSSKLVDVTPSSSLTSPSISRLLGDASPALTRRKSPGADLSPSKGIRRSFSPKTFGKKLFADGKASKLEDDVSGADENKRLLEPDTDGSYRETDKKTEGRRNWSSLKGKKKQADDGKCSKDSAGCLEKFRWNGERRRSESTSGLSRNLSSSFRCHDLSQAGHMPPEEMRGDEALTIPPMEGLLFSFGVGIGVMSMMNAGDEPTSKAMHFTSRKEEQPLVGSAQDTKRTSESIAVIDKKIRDCETTTKVLQEGVLQDLHQMAELEAQLEAELEHLTGQISAQPERSCTDFEELDPEGIAGVADGDLSVDGLPTWVDWDDDNDDFVPAEEQGLVNGSVPPKELARLLRKLESSWQEKRLLELEKDLQEAEDKLHIAERELYLLRERMRISSPTTLGVQLKTPSSHEVVQETMSMICSPQESPAEKVVLDSSDAQEQVKQEIFVPEMTCDQFVRNQSSTQIGELVPDLRTLLQSIKNQSSMQMGEQPVPDLRTLLSAGSVANSCISEAQASETQSNDDVCDEFLKSVFDSLPQEDMCLESSPVPAAQSLESPDNPSRSDVIKSSASLDCALMTSLSGCSSCEIAPATPRASEDIDSVVGKLRMAENKSVKSALDALLLWEAASADDSSGDDLAMEEAALLYSRKSAGRTATPQKTTVKEIRLEPQARTVLDNSATLDRKNKVWSIDLSMDDASSRGLGHVELPSKREDRQKRMSDLVMEEEREALKGESPGLGKLKSFSGVHGLSDDVLGKERNFPFYDSSRCDTQVSAPKADSNLSVDLTSYWQREEMSRAGTNSPIGSSSSKGLHYRPHPRLSGVPFPTKLFHHPPSERESEAVSPSEMLES